MIIELHAVISIIFVQKLKLELDLLSSYQTKWLEQRKNSIHGTFATKHLRLAVFCERFGSLADYKSSQGGRLGA